MQRTWLETPIARPILRSIGKAFLGLQKWRIEGTIDDLDKGVMIAAPHTSNWDFVFTMALFFAKESPVRWMGKKEMFPFPFRGFMRWLGGIPVDRENAFNTAREAVAMIRENEKIIILVPPEGTRTKVKEWKLGFYLIAKRANVPIIMGYLDFKRKLGGYGPRLVPSDDRKADLAELQAFYNTITGKCPEKTSPVVALPNENVPAVKSEDADS